MTNTNTNTNFTNFDTHAMQLALQQAQQAFDAGEVPVGAVLTVGEQVMATGFNRPISHSDPTAHAEIMALREACKVLNNYRLPEDACLYVTLEPCTMCLGALVHARLPRLVFAAAEPKAGVVVSQSSLLEQGHFNHQIVFEQGLLQEQSSQLLKDFFKHRREQKAQAKRLAKAHAGGGASEHGVGGCCAHTK